MLELGFSPLAGSSFKSVPAADPLSLKFSFGAARLAAELP